MNRPGLILILACLWGGIPAHAAESPKAIRAVRTAISPVVNGILNEEQWQQASAVLDFTQFDPDEGGIPTELTSVRILYDHQAVYVGVICYDAHPREIVRQLTRRDRGSEADRVTVMIDSYMDRQSAFVFSVNVSGIQSDGVLSQGGVVYDDTWDAVWTARTRVYRDGWSAEFAIPFNALRFSPVARGDYRWGINFRRYISRKNETVEWVMVPRSERLQIPFWGVLTGIRGIDPPVHLDIAPYVSGSAVWHSPAPAGISARTLRSDAGVDIKYGVTRNFTLDATVNPDFGQVEVDRSVLNLTVFETFFPEKRPFFTEGAQLFTFGTSHDNTPLPVFFSRRIGRRPRGSTGLFAPARGVIEDNPQVTTILGAAKLSGRSASGLALGAFTAVTSMEEAELRDSAGVVTRVQTEPAASYSVLRLRQDFPGGSWVGGIGTLAAREGVLPAATAGADWGVNLGGIHNLEGYAAVARASVDRGGSDGAAARILFSRISADRWFYAASYDAATRRFDINDLGFFARPREHGGYLQLLYRENFARGIFRRYALSLVPEVRWNWDGVRTLTGVEGRGSFEFDNFWQTDIALLYDVPAYDDAERGLIGIYRRPRGGRGSLTLQTDHRNAVAAAVSFGGAVDARGHTMWFIAGGLTLRPAPWMDLHPSVTWKRVVGEETGVFSGGEIVGVSDGSRLFSLFADRDIDELDLTLRGTITFLRNVSLQYASQMLLARGRHGEFRRLAGESTFLPEADRGTLYDFNEIRWYTNVVLRWEYFPGSTLYLAWTQSRYGDVGQYMAGFGNRLGDAFRLPREDVLLLKITYWFGF